MLKELLVLGTLLIVTVSAVKYDLKYIRNLLDPTKKPHFDVKMREDDYNAQVFREEYDDDVGTFREEDDETFREEDDETFREEEEEEEEEKEKEKEKEIENEKEKEKEKETSTEEVNVEKDMVNPLQPFFSNITVTIHNRKDKPLVKTLDKLTTIALKKTALIFHGWDKSEKNYVEDFLNSTTKALVKVGYEEIYTLNYDKVLTPNKTVENLVKLVFVGQYLGSILDDKNKAKDLIIVGDDIGNVITSTISVIENKKIDYIFGINERVFTEPLFFDFYLRADMGKLVQTINTNNYNNTYAHRNFVIKGGDAKVNAYKLFEEDILANGTKYMSTQCVNYDSFTKKKCDGFFKVSLWNKIPADPLNVGNFYYTLSKKRSSSQKRCA